MGIGWRIFGAPALKFVDSETAHKLSIKTLSRFETLDFSERVPRLTDFAKIALKLSGVLTLELHEDVQDVVAPDHVELLLELEESSELSEQL